MAGFTAGAVRLCSAEQPKYFQVAQAPLCKHGRTSSVLAYCTHVAAQKAGTGVGCRVRFVPRHDCDGQWSDSKQM